MCTHGSGFDSLLLKALTHLTLLGGMTECCGKISMSMLSPDVRRAPFDFQLATMCTSGRPFSIMDVKVVDSAGAPVAPFMVGRCRLTL
jgi:hypothetical protein